MGVMLSRQPYGPLFSIAVLLPIGAVFALFAGLDFWGSRHWETLEVARTPEEMQPFLTRTGDAIEAWLKSERPAFRRFDFAFEFRGASGERIALALIPREAESPAPLCLISLKTSRSKTLPEFQRVKDKVLALVEA